MQFVDVGLLPIMFQWLVHACTSKRPYTVCQSSDEMGTMQPYCKAVIEALDQRDFRQEDQQL